MGGVSEVFDKYADTKADMRAARRRRIINYIDGYHRLILQYTANIPSHTVRKFFYKHVFCVSMKKDAVIYHGAELRAPWSLEVGEGTSIGDNAILDARRGGIRFGKSVNVGSRVCLWT